MAKKQNTLARIAKLQQLKKDAQDQIKEWDEEYKALLDSLELGLLAQGDYVAEVKNTVRFDAATAKKNLPEDLYKGICVLKPDSTMAKKILTGLEYEDCQRVTGRSITFKEGV